MSPEEILTFRFPSILRGIASASTAEQFVEVATAACESCRDLSWAFSESRVRSPSELESAALILRGLAGKLRERIANFKIDPDDFDSVSKEYIPHIEQRAEWFLQQAKELQTTPQFVLVPV